MYTLNGFVAIGSLANNTPDAVSVIGELSNYAATFSTEIGTYTQADYPGLALISMESKDDNGRVTASVDAITAVLAIAKWSMAQATAGTNTIDRDTYLQNLKAEFGDQWTDLSCGAMATDGELWLPEWVSGSFTALGDNQIKVWFSDPAFRAQYPRFEITVVPPIDNIDQLFEDHTVTKPLLEAVTPSVILDRLNEKTKPHPYTISRTLRYKAYDPVDDDYYTPSDWTVALYGEAGNSIDNINQALIAWILANSTHSRTEWAKVLPDLFIPTEFVICPLWHQYSVPNQTVKAGLYSPTLRLSTAAALMAKAAPGYEASHIAANLTMTDCLYKSVGFLAVGNVGNRDGKVALDEKFPDYAIIPTTSIDFDRISTKTQEWIRMLYALLLVAEELTTESDIPSGYTRVVRENVMYATKTFDDVQYLVVTKESENALAAASS